MNIFIKGIYDLSTKSGLFADIQYRSIAYKITGIDDDLRDITQDHDFVFINPKA